MADTEDDNTEITLGMGKLLGLFFGLVILCGISLGAGYSLGRNAAKQAAAAAALSTTAENPAPSAPNKPEAAQAAAPKPDCATASDASPQSTSTPNPANLTFYQTVKQKGEHSQLPPSEPAPTPAARPAGTPTLGAGYLIQIAAVRYPDDAKLLSETLQKQRYPVVVSQPGDKLFHVQVGPYADIKEAEAIRARLVGAGYTAFLKH